MQKRSKFSKKIVTGFLALLLGVTILGSFTFASPVAAADDPAAKTNVCKSGAVPDPQKPCIPSADDVKSTPDPAAKTCTGNDCSGLITKYVNPFIKLLSALVAVIVATSIAAGGVQYASAGGDPGKVANAKKRIYNSIIALLAYLFMFAFLQWLLPGGIV